MNIYKIFEEIKNEIEKEDLIEFIEYALDGGDIKEIISDFIEATFNVNNNDNET